MKKATIRRDYDDCDFPPPVGADAIEPAMLDESEVPAHNFEIVSPETGSDAEPNTDTQASPTTRQASTHSEQTTSNQDNQDSIYEIQKILRKKFTRGHWQFRIRWKNFDDSHNSWVAYQDLSPQCQQYVQDMHASIPTDRNSQRKYFLHDPIN